MSLGIGAVPRAPARRFHFSTTELMQQLQQQLGTLRGARLCVAYSGGADSTALLGALAAGASRRGIELRALHVNHQLQPQAASWARQALATATALGVAARTLRVRVPRAGQSLEAAARTARYAALAAALAPGEHLLTAHHQEDQFETLLLQLLRGAGVAGLAAMPARAPFAGGWLLRPLLGVPRASLRDYAQRRGLPWVEDPSNADTRFDRNFLRLEILPPLLARWPSAARSVARSAGHLAEAQSLLSQLAERLLAHAADGTALRLAALRSLAPAQQRLLLRHWLVRRSLPLPGSRQLGEALDAMLAIRPDANPEMRWPGACLRRHGGRVYATSGARSATPPRSLVWQWRRAPIMHLQGAGVLRLLPHPLGALALDRLPARLQLQFRAGGETLALPFGHKPLKNLLQELDIPPWQRARLPLVMAGRQLLAVAGCWLNPAVRAGARTRRRAHLQFVPE